MNISSASGFDPTKLWENLFKKVDSNSDGSIDKTEFESAVSTMAKNQNVSTDEADAMFKKLDTDSDGKVSEKEMLAALKTAGDQMRANMPPPPPDGAQNGQDISLTDDQKKTVDSILSKYDASNLTSSDVKAINQSISNAGISFSKALGDQIEADGFSIQTMMQLSPPPTKGTTGPTSTTDAAAETNGQNAMFSELIKSLQSSDTSSATSSSDNSSVSSLFSDLVKSLKSSNSNDDEIASLINNFLQELQTSTQYTQSGSLTASTSTTQSLLAAMV
jgi:hypothetical protein